eukprot:TRINITY_DN1937_c0_g1_i2.p1 TRINITY_DN1937_c0_g1~~TRINITY_DN1937_c0_g1_i2.p1  ORF type:complete len:480 (-),score=113.62 TRINITY_DN1937_c0_g1_i2:51-1490(-)
MRLLLILLLFVLARAEYEYGCMIDAGSSGSRIYVYQWPQRISSDSTPPRPSAITQQGWSIPQIPGLSDYASHPEDAGKSLQSLVDFARNITLGLLDNDLSRLARVPIYLKATAGMRILPAAISSRIMKSVRDFLRQSGFLFEDSFARVISGEEEGVFGWITTNYLMGTLGSDVKDTYGAMDMGGASTQITFGPSEEILAGFFPLRIDSHSYALYTHSFLYMGINEAKYRVYENVIRWQENSGRSGPIYEHPCLAIGFSVNYTYTPSPGGNARNVMFVGGSNSSLCMQLTQQLLGKDYVCSSGLGRCSVAGVYQPSLSGNFVAFSNFYSVFHSLKFPTNVTLAAVDQRMQYLCNLNWTQLSQEYKPDQYLPYQCGNAMYLLSLLRDGYGFAPDATNIIYNNKVGPNEIGWTLGAILFEENLLPWSISARSCSSYRNTAVGLGIGLAFAGALLVAAAAALYMVSRHPSKTDKDNDEYHKMP